MCIRDRSEIGFDFDGYAVGGKGGGESLQIRGKLSYEEEDLYLSALKYGEGNSWRFSGVFYNGKEFGLMSLWNLLSVGEAPDILKAIGVPVYTAVSYTHLEKFTFHHVAPYNSGFSCEIHTKTPRGTLPCEQ